MRQFSKLSINLQHFSNNLDLIRQMSGQAEILFMVKANAYGHGLIPMSKYALDLGIKNLGVATLLEAIEIRKNISQVNFDLYVFSDTGLQTELAQQLAELKIIPVLHQMQDLEYFLANNKIFSNIPLVLKFDTGMNRLGLNKDELDKILNLLKKFQRKKIFHLMSHLASSYFLKKDGDKTQTQQNRFEEIVKYFKTNGIEIEHTSLANSGAIEQNIATQYSMVRPGLMVYGPQSTMTSDRVWKGRNISSLISWPLKKFLAQKGTPIGYGGHILHEDGVLMVLPIGYGDGILNYYTGNTVFYNEIKGQIIARVNMDLTYVFFAKMQLSDFKENSPIVFWDYKSESIEQFANEAKTIPYQIFCSLTQRIPREYLLR